MSQNIGVSIVIILFVIVRFLIRELRERHLSNAQLFIFPGIMGLAWAILAFEAGTASHVNDVDLGVRSAIALAFGILVGVLVARFTTVRIGDDGKVFFRGSNITVAIWVAALLVRFGARYAFPAERSISGALAYAESLVLLVFVATVVVRILVFRKAQTERARGSTLTETAV